MAKIDCARFRVAFLHTEDPNINRRWDEATIWLTENLAESPKFSYERSYWWAVFVDPEQAMQFKLAWGL